MSRKIKAIICKCNEQARVSEIDTSLESLQELVDGFIEFYYLDDFDAMIICNDEGKINGMDINRTVKDQNGHVIEVMFGDFIIAKNKEYDDWDDEAEPDDSDSEAEPDDSDGFGEFTQEELNVLLERFKYPEDVFMCGREIIPIERF